MQYAPVIEDARPVHRHEQSGFRAVLLTEIRSPGSIEYTHVLLVSRLDSDAPVVAVAAEVNSAPPAVRSGSHVLDFFPGEGHVNMGASDEWADLAIFEARALEVAAKHLGLEGLWSLAPVVDGR